MERIWDTLWKAEWLKGTLLVHVDESHRRIYGAVSAANQAQNLLKKTQYGVQLVDLYLCSKKSISLKLTAFSNAWNK